MFYFKLKASALAALFLAMASGHGFAATCDAVRLNGDVSGFSVGAGGARQCETGSTNNDKVGGGGLQVNAGMMFGHADWTLLGKLNPGGEAGDAPGALLAGSGGQSGIFRLDPAAIAAFDELMVVLKGPAAFDYTAFLVRDLAGLGLGGEYRSVFYKDGKKGQFQDISHITFYGREGFPGIVSTPIPAAAPLLLGAIGALAMLRRRRRRR